MNTTSLSPSMARLSLTVSAWLSALLACPALSAQGVLDPRFGNGGQVVTDLPGPYERASSVALQPDGKIVVAGLATGTQQEFMVARYLPNGSPDPRFGTGGYVTVDLGGAGAWARAVAIQRDGKIVAVGSNSQVIAMGPRTAEFAVMRFHKDGSLDQSFDGDGIVLTSFNQSGNADDANAVVIQPDQKIVVVGESAAGASLFAVARYRPDGSLDETFNGNGKVTTSFPGASAFGRTVALQRDGKIVVGGNAYNAGDDFALTRYLPNGLLDESFGNQGRLITDLGARDVIECIAMQSDDKIVAGGLTSTFGIGDFAVARYHTDGSMDPSFDGDGIASVDFGANDCAKALVIQRDGKIVIAGRTSPSNLRADVALARVLADGTLDTTFGGTGTVTEDLTGEFDVATGLAMQADGKIVVAGQAGLNWAASIAVLRFVGQVWEDLGNGLAGTHGIPTAIGSGNLLPGHPLNVRIGGALGGSVGALVIGATRVDLPVFGGTLVPSPDLTIGVIVRPSGAIALSTTWPGGIPAGIPIYYQYWIVDSAATAGLSASNAVSGTSQ